MQTVVLMWTSRGCQIAALEHVLVDLHKPVHHPVEVEVAGPPPRRLANA